MTATLLSIGLVLLLILLGSFFVAAEMGLVSLREGQAKSIAARGRRGERVARLHADPNRFLASVQVGVTFSGFLSAAFGSATLAAGLAPLLERWGMSPRIADITAVVLITVLIAYLAILLGELVPKRLALQRPEGAALLLGPTLDRLATAFRPVIWLLSKSTDAVVRLLGGNPSAGRETITEEELRDLVVAHEALTGEERRLIAEVFAAGERRLHEVMLPRTEVDFLDASLPVFKAAREVAAKPHSRYPVVHGSQDDVVGFVHVRDLYDPATAGRSPRVGELARPVLLLPGTLQILPALSQMRREGQHLAIVLDEYGGTDGIVTLEDLLEELIGDIRDEYDVAGVQTRMLRGGDVEVDGLLNVDDFGEQTGLPLPEGPYETVAGYLMHALGRVPEVGDRVEALEHRFLVTELDGRRVARVRLTPVPPVPADSAPAGNETAPGDAPAEMGSANPLR